MPRQVAAEMYSAPSIVLQNRQPNGVIKVFDDFRESYAWLRYNTEPDDKARCKAHILSIAENKVHMFFMLFMQMQLLRI